MKRVKRDFLYGRQAREALQTGINKVSDAVKVTLGPAGRLALLGKVYGSGTVTKDGVTVARSVELDNPFENEGARLCKETASKTNDTAGDGTTTATVLAQSLVNEGLRYVNDGGSAVKVVKGMEKAVTAVLEEIDSVSTPITTKEQIRFVASISGNGDEVGEMIAEAMDKVGKSGVITIENGTSKDNQLNVVEGFQFDRGYLSPFFVNNLEKMIAEYEDVAILTVEGKLTIAKDVANILEAILKLQKPTLIICDELDGDGLTTAIINRTKSSLPIVFVKSPSVGDRKRALLEDICYLTGGKLISEEAEFDLSKLNSEHFGRAKKVTVSEDSTTIIEGGGLREEIETRIKLLTAQMENSDNKFDKERYQERLAKLSGGVAVIKVGGATETEMVERKHRFEDALNATRAAIQGGIVPGGGATLLRAASVLRNIKVTGDELHGVEIVKNALQSPIKQIAENAGVNGSVIADRVARTRKTNHGFDASTGIMVDLVKSGIVDPAKVTKQALINAASIARMVLMTEVLITEKEADNGKN